MWEYPLPSANSFYNSLSSHSITTNFEIQHPLALFNIAHMLKNIVEACTPIIFLLLHQDPRPQRGFHNYHSKAQLLLHSVTRSALCLTRTRATRTRPPRDAKSNAVDPLSSCVVASAPCSRSMRATDTCPPREARCSAVDPLLS